MNAEDKARALGCDPTALQARLLDAASCLIVDYRKLMRGAHFDFEAKTLTGKGLRLRWQLRRYPDEAEHYRNQQTSMGIVLLEFFDE